MGHSEGQESLFDSPRPPKEQDGDMSRFHLTRFPFAATINGEPVFVWPDWIEREDDALR